MFLVDGFRTTVVFTAFPGILLREREVHPPELDANGEIDTTTMLNARMRTRAAKSLVTMGKLMMSCQYDPTVYIVMTALPAGGGAMGVVTTITVTFPDGTTLAFLGWINKFTPSSHKEGEFPIAEVEVIPSNTSLAPVAATASNDVIPTVVAGAGADNGGGAWTGMVVR
jgi:hypothetical protein